jgi:hypothetical protein
MADTLTPAALNEVMARGDTYEATWSIEEGADADSAVPVSLAARTYRLTVRHPDTGAVLAQVTEVANSQGVIERDADAVTGRLRWRVDQSVTAAWPLTVPGECGPLKRDLEETSGGDVQTLLLGLITVKEDQSV